MANVALVETKPGKYKYEFDFKFDRFALCSDSSINKVLKKDCDIKINIDDYDWIILVGSEATKYFTKISSVTDYTGKAQGKFIISINPGMIAFKPEVQKVWDKTLEEINLYVSGNKPAEVDFSSVVEGIRTETRALEYLEEAIKYKSDLFSIDSETTGLYPRNGLLQGISISYDGVKGVYIDIDCITEEVQNRLNFLFSVKKPIFHNSKFDIAFFEYHLGMKITSFHDTMLMHYVLDETQGTHGLKQLALKYTPYGDYEREKDEWVANYCKENKIKKEDFDWGVIPFEIMYKYAAMDALVTFMLFDKFSVLFKNIKFKQLYEHILIPGTRLVIDMQENGVPFDRTRLVNGQALMEKEIWVAEKILKDHHAVASFCEKEGKDFNPNSTLQLRKLLFDYLKLKPTGIKTETGAHSTNAEVLEILAEESEVPQLILDIRQKGKIKNTYLDKIIPELDKDSRLRTGFNLHSTTSGRLSSSGKLNMQQLPRDNPIVKGCILPPLRRWVVVSVDLSTAEMYIAAVLSGDQALMDIFRKGGDFHSSVAKLVFNLPCSVEEVKALYKKERQAAKAISFGILFGASARKISQEVTKFSGELFTESEAQEVITDYFKKFSTLKKWIKTSHKFIEDNCFIYSIFGRKRRLPNVQSSDKGLKNHELRSGLNFLIQSVASDVNLLAAIDTNNEIKRTGLRARMFALVHDSILAEVHEDDIDVYTSIVTKYITMDRGASIPNCPIGFDVEVGDDYSMGKFNVSYGNV